MWSDGTLDVRAATDPDGVAALLRHSGFRVRMLTTGDLCSKARLSAAEIDTLVLPYADVYPAAGGDALRHYSASRICRLTRRCWRSAQKATPAPDDCASN